MKNLKIFLLILSFFTVNAVRAQKTYTYTVDSLFTHLNKSSITTGILYDRAYPLAAVHLFNKKEVDTAYSDYLIEAYRELFASSYSQAGWINPDSLVNKANMATSLRTIPVGLSFYTYNVIDTNAIANNLIQMHSDSLYYDTPNRASSPYNTLNTFIGSPMQDSVRADSAVVFYFSTNLYVNKSAFTLTSLKVDFNDGKGLVAVTLGSSHSVTYQSPDGYRNLKFVLKMSNGITYTTYGKIKVYNTGTVPGAKVAKAQSASQACALIQDFLITGYNSFTGYGETTGSTGSGNLELSYASNGSCDGSFKSPILIVDTYDPNYNTTNQDLYYEFNTNYSSGGNVGYLDYLRSQGYDIATLIFNRNSTNNVEIPGGEDYVERNARTVISAIQWLKAHTTGSNKLIILGPSNGGLITQYALRYMEQNNLTHNVKLWVTLDAPFLGANAPIGLQEFIDYNSPSTAQGLVGNPAAKELLLKQYSNAFDRNTSAPAFRSQFVATMNSMGFPVGDPGQPFRKIAITDGSLGGNEFNTPCEEGFSFSISHTFTIDLFLFKVRIKVSVANAQMYFTPTTGTTCTVLNANKVLTPAETITNTTSSTSSSVDVAPGGLYNFIGQTQQQGNGMIISFASIPFVFSFSNVIANSSFISTKSALAFTGTNQKYNENISNRNLVCTNETPFNSYFGSFTTNQFHATLWNDAMNWLTQEINGNPQPPSFLDQTNSSYAISGPTTACTSGNYSITNIPVSATVAWSASPSYDVTLTPSGQTVNVSLVQSGNVTLSAIVTYNCQAYTATPLTFYIGGPATPVVTGIVKTVSGVNQLVYSTTAGTGLNYQWQINGVNQSGNSPTCTIQAPACTGNPNPVTYNVQVTETNICGSASGCAEFQFLCGPPLTLVATGGCAQDNVQGNSLQSSSALVNSVVPKFYPNPSNQTVTITTNLNTQTNLQPIISPFSYILYDQKGNILRNGSSSGADVVVDVSKLTSAMYILYITVNNTTYKNKVFINHE